MKKLILLLVFPLLLMTQTDTLNIPITVTENRLDNVGLLAVKDTFLVGENILMRLFAFDPLLTPMAGDTALIQVEMGLNRYAAAPDHVSWVWFPAQYYQDSLEMNCYSFDITPMEADTGLWYLLGRVWLPDYHYQYAAWNGTEGGEYDGESYLPQMAKVVSNISSIDGIPTEFRIHQPYPNPFNPFARIQIDLPESSQLTLRLYDLRGRLVSTLFQGRAEAGFQQFAIDGSRYASGIYILAIQSEMGYATRKLMLLK
jgi:hypothetical protein